MSVPLSSAFFAGGVLVGATGAFLLRPSPPPAPAQPSSPPPPPPGTPLTLAGHSLIDASSLTLTDAAGQPVVRTGSVGPIVDLLRNTAYISAYDRRLRHPAWTAEHLTAASFAPPASGGGSNGGDGGSGGVDRRYSVFKEDPRIPELFRARLADYFRSGYDRGHMVPAADAKTSQTAMDETFFLSNIAPQVGEGFNRDYWAHLEDFTRRLAKASADGRAPRWKDVYVFTVPLYLPRSYLEPAAATVTGDGSSSAVDERRERFRVSYEVIGSPPSISVPTHFAKVIYALPASSSSSLLSRGGGGVLGAFVLPNARIPNEVPLRQFFVPVESVERAAGLTLFSDDVKRGARPLCDSVDCSIVVREFNDSRKKTLSAPPPTPAAAASTASQAQAQAQAWQPRPTTTASKAQ